MYPEPDALDTETELFAEGVDLKRSNPDAKTILIVDDEPSILNLLAGGLEFYGYNTLVASTGAYAEAIVLEKDVDCVLLDIVMPDRSGVEILEQLKRKHPDLPVIMITGCGRFEFAVDCFKLGAFDLLAKPVLLETLLPVIEKSLSLPLPEDSHIGARVVPEIEGFRFIRVLGEGSMGIVYLVEKDDGHGHIQLFALKSFKQLKEVDHSTRATLKERFTNEAKAAGSIQHPNVIKVYDSALDKDGVPYILMEFFDGMNLKAYLKKNKLNFEQKMHILKQIAFALSIIHEKDICHRDLKLSNILINDALLVKIMDFGIARIKDSTLTPTAHVMGTPAYMSPEAFSSAKVDHRSDIFALGSITYEILTGKRAFRGPDVTSLAYNVRFKDPVWPRKLGVDIPKPIEKGLKKMLSKKPEKRIQNVNEVYELFSEYSQPH
ncbi:hypothetical protein BVX99_01660 [bacterium F16]|nr:hypothetical protein BVX99_01660 [bacterium F16]